MLSKAHANDIYYFCSLVEYIARQTKNHHKDIISLFSIDEITQQLKLACVNHCLPFEQVSNEIIDRFMIQEGDYDFISGCRYNVPGYLAIGKVYQSLVVDYHNDNEGKICIAQAIKDVFTSFICDKISYYNSSMYYSSPDYLYQCFRSGEVLE